MGHMSYNRVSNSRGFSSRSCRGGFKLNPKRLSVQRLSKRFMCLFRLFDRLRLSYAQAVQLLKKVFCRRRGGIKRNNSNSSRRSLMREEQNKGIADPCRLRSYGRSNSFYAEAIADCLEFIKRSSVSLDQNPVSNIQNT
ncbi:Protein phosphatase [Quillaja saponaria]|uniref:Protein phosphatase n=1 Tax=Quillaja saponaria TaxID=32244 RepID=A0AAD7L7X3_QUISA|nr:Protein phosphatase [Quillaja saponaria]